MAKTSNSIEIGLSPEDTWAGLTDLSRYPEWLVILEAWNGPIPTSADLRKGTKVSSIFDINGFHWKFDWVVEKLDHASHVRLKGKAKAGIKAKLDLGVAPTAKGTEVTFTVDLGGLPLIGPVGKAVAEMVSGDLTCLLYTSDAADE